MFYLIYLYSSLGERIRTALRQAVKRYETAPFEGGQPHTFLRG